MQLTLAHSPDADDAFMFYALATGKVDTGDLQFEHELQGIETLNRRVMAGELDISAISIHAYAYVSDRYILLPHGFALGDRYGPRVVAREEIEAGDLAGRKVVAPGAWTSAYLALRLYEPRAEVEFVPFDQIIDHVARGDADAGVIIHEGQLTYRDKGYHKVEDFGERWEKETGLPLPLGLDVVRRDLGHELAEEINRAMRASIEWAYTNEEEALTYSLQFGRGLERELGRRFVKMYVSDLTKDMGEAGEKALNELYRRAATAGVVDRAPELELIR